MSIVVGVTHFRAAVAQVRATARTADAVEKVAAVARQGRAEGAELVVFPEALLGGYPRGAAFGAAIGDRSPSGRDESLSYSRNAVTVSGHYATDYADPDAVVCRGGSVIVNPFGDVLAGPLYDEEGLLVAELDLGEVTRGRFDFDAAGHYSRPDLFRLTVDTRVREPVAWRPPLEQQPPGTAARGDDATDGVSRDKH